MIGISYHSGGMVDDPLNQVIPHLAGIGYDAIEIVCGPEAHIRTGDPLEPQIDAARQQLAEHGLKVAAINPYTQPALANFAQDDYDGAVERWSLLVDIAVALDACVVNFLPGFLPDGDRVTWELLIRVLKDLTAYAGPKGIDLAIHNHEGLTIDSPDKCLCLIDQVGSEHLKVLCDITNFCILGGDVAQAVERVAPHIVHCHVKGVKGMYPYNEFLIPGASDDELPFEPFAAALGAAGYQRYVSVETFKWMPAAKTQVTYDMISESLRALGLRG